MTHNARATLTTLCIATLLAIVVTTTVAQQNYYDRKQIPGSYTVGLYADRAGTSRVFKLEEGQDAVEAWIGLSGDSTQTFSAVVFRIELPDGVELGGPVRWLPIPGLQQWKSAVGLGVQVEFNYECQEQINGAPAMLGRVHFKVAEDFDRGDVVVGPHNEHGLSVELCDHALWPKPYAQGLPLTIERKRSFWSKLQKLFG